MYVCVYIYIYIYINRERHRYLFISKVHAWTAGSGARCELVELAVAIGKAQMGSAQMGSLRMFVCLTEGPFGYPR